jgi:hypothetical protein
MQFSLECSFDAVLMQFLKKASKLRQHCIKTASLSCQENKKTYNVFNVFCEFLCHRQPSSARGVSNVICVDGSS